MSECIDCGGSLSGYETKNLGGERHRVSEVCVSLLRARIAELEATLKRLNVARQELESEVARLRSERDHYREDALTHEAICVPKIYDAIAALEAEVSELKAPQPAPCKECGRIGDIGDTSDPCPSCGWGGNEVKRG